MWFQSCSWGGMLEKKQVEMNFCLVGHGSAVPLNYLDPGEKLLSSAGFQSFAASSAWKNCDKEKKGEQVLQREEPGIDDCFCWAVPSQCEADRVRLWPLGAGSFLRLLLRDSRNSSARTQTWKIPGWAGISSQAVFSQRTFKILHCKHDSGIFLKAIRCSLSQMSIWGVLNPASLWLLGLSSPKCWWNVCWKAQMPCGTTMEKTAAQPSPNYPKVQWGNSLENLSWK